MSGNRQNPKPEATEQAGTTGTSGPAAEKAIRVLQLMDKTAIRDASIHGVSRLILAWWPEFADTEVKMRLCVLRSSDAAAAVFREAGIEPEYIGRGRFDPRTWFDLVRILRRDRIDVLHCHGYGASTFGRLLGLRYGIPVILHEHFVDANIPVYQRWIDRLLAPATTTALAVSRAVGEFLAGPRSVSRDRIRVLYNSVPQGVPDPESSDPEKSGPDAVTELGAEKSTCALRVGIVGRLDPVKGHADFLDAAALLVAARAEVEFWIVGDGELAAELEQKARDLDLSSHVQFLGHCDDVPRLLNQLDLLVACSHSEGFSLAAAEAMACGLAVVGTDVGGIPEVVEHEVTGLLVSPHSPEQLARAVLQLLGDDELRLKMGARGRERCQALFSMETTRSELRDLYRRLVEGDGPPDESSW